MNDELLIQLWLEEPDMGIAEIAERFAVAQLVVETALRDLGLVVAPSTQAATVVELLTEGMAAANVAEKLGLKVSTVYTYASRAKETPAIHRHLDTAQWTALIKDYDAGETISYLARQYGISRAAIYKKLHK